MGDTAADSQGLQEMLKSQAKAESNDPLEQGMTAMFSRDGMTGGRSFAYCVMMAALVRCWQTSVS